MKFKTHPHKSDLLTLTRDDLQDLLAGRELSVSALNIRMEEEPKPDRIEQCTLHMNLGWRYGQPPEGWDHAKHFVEVGEFKLTFDGNTNKLKSAEVL
jgi:hypothetical protein